jgi:tetratricopeptide (TPR) repeat protein
MTAPSNLTEIELPTHLCHFTNREAAIAAFDALWPGDGTWVLAFDGMSGNGKTTLIDFLIETRCKPDGTSWAILDFEGSRGLTLRTDWRALLEALAGQWGLAEHPTYASGRESARAEYETIHRSLQMQIGLIAEQGQIEGSPITIDASQSEALRQADHRARDDTGAALLAAAVVTHAGRRLALFLDTYETLSRAADKEYAGWLWAWLSNAATRLPGLRVIVGGREKLTGLPRRVRRQESLHVFKQDDSDQLLSKLGVDDPAWRKAVFERLAGGHPLLTEMAADLWQEARQSDRPLPVEAIPKLAGQEQAVEWLTGRILDRLEEPIKSAVRWAALLRRFDQEILAAMLLDDAGRLDDDAFEQLRSYSFVSPARVGQGQACHDLLRRVQNAYLSANKPRACREFHARAAAHFAAEGDVVEALYHGLMAGEEAVPATWYEATHGAYLGLDWPRWSALLEVVESPELPPSPELEAQARFWRALWHRWRYETDPALASYDQALALFQAVGDRLGEANTLQAIGDVQRFRDDYDAALASYDQALALFQAVGDRLGEANTLLATADVARGQEKWAESRELYEQAIQLYQAIGDGYSMARVHYRLGDWHKAQEHRPEAAHRYRQAISLWSAIGLDNLIEQILIPRLQSVADQEEK